jgi:hypothetical protein
LVWPPSASIYVSIWFCMLLSLITSQLITMLFSKLFHYFLNKLRNCLQIFFLFFCITIFLIYCFKNNPKFSLRFETRVLKWWRKTHYWRTNFHTTQHYKSCYLYLYLNKKLANISLKNYLIG